MLLLDPGLDRYSPERRGTSLNQACTSENLRKLDRPLDDDEDYGGGEGF